ncbi:hypothetical protein [Duganella sp. FT27W]|uniref:DUF7940 domain-containing protein n=1 Tax=Duganella sp. FT27W TaxID=2654636 RepID=UPI00128E0147|nr:hypothetical protein [Duganella sp. FT27W]MPQ56318.1 hypothetical protein [Duganella sp. FT27W]
MLDKLRNAWRSRTIWINATLLGLLPLFDMINSALPQLHEFLPENMYKTVGVATVLVNILLRFFTSTSLENK